MTFTAARSNPLIVILDPVYISFRPLLGFNFILFVPPRHCIAHLCFANRMETVTLSLCTSSELFVLSF
jgi:hypothetical protein